MPPAYFLFCYLVLIPYSHIHQVRCLSSPHNRPDWPRTLGRFCQRSLNLTFLCGNWLINNCYGRQIKVGIDRGRTHLDPVGQSQSGLVGSDSRSKRSDFRQS